MPNLPQSWKRAQGVWRIQFREIQSTPEQFRPTKAAHKKVNQTGTSMPASTILVDPTLVSPRKNGMEKRQSSLEGHTMAPA